MSDTEQETIQNPIQDPVIDSVEDPAILPLIDKMQEPVQSPTPESIIPSVEQANDSIVGEEINNSLTENSDVTGNDEVECGEISSPKVTEEEDVKPFAVECELDFEDEAESGSIASKKKKEAPLNQKVEKSAEGEDDGECSDEVDEEDLEEGELKDENPVLQENNATSKPNSQTKTVCRFYNRGQCFYGNNCRFLHVNFLKTGNYSMFAPAARACFTGDFYDSNVPIAHGMVNNRSIPPNRTSPEFSPPPQQSSPTQPAVVESAWERGLREAKELVKKANKRKVEEPDFEEKRLNLSLVVNEKNIPDTENEPAHKKKKRENSMYPKRDYEDPHDIYDDCYDQRMHWRDGHLDNFDIRYNRERRDRGRGRMDRERDKFPKSPERNKDRFRDDRFQPAQSRSRVDEYFDPWRRSKSPKGNARRTRSRSGSYSSVSSYSYSDRSSRSSCSYSRSSSRSSSRSPPPHQKRTPSPTAINPPFLSPKLGTNKFTTMKKKPIIGRPNSRAKSRTPSRSRSRSFSRSISMDSVSSASSSITHSSHSETGRQNSQASVLRKEENPSTVVGEKPAPTVAAATSNPTTIPLPSMYLNYSNRDPIKIEKKEVQKEIPIIDEDERDPLEEKFLAPAELPFPSLQHLLPTEKVKEPFKVPLKPQIKLTLLNKNPRLNSLPKKELDVIRKPNDELLKPPGFFLGGKGPLSPPAPPVLKPAPVLLPKKSASSRRDELLKQLKAVEDAIARKRAKFG